MKKLLCVCLLAALSVACLAAQDVFATIGGTILDPSGAADKQVLSVGSPPSWPLTCRSCGSEESETGTQPEPQQAEQVLCYRAVHS